MLFTLFKMVIWLTGLVVVSYFILSHFGYEVNWDYWNERRSACEQRLTDCRKDLIKTGLDGAKDTCNFKCVDPSILIHKK